MAVNMTKDEMIAIFLSLKLFIVNYFFFPLSRGFLHHSGREYANILLARSKFTKNIRNSNRFFIVLEHQCQKSLFACCFSGNFFRNFSRLLNLVRVKFQVSGICGWFLFFWLVIYCLGTGLIRVHCLFTLSLAKRASS